MTDKLIDVKIVGISPLIINKFTDEDQLQASAGARTSAMAVDRGDPKDQCEARLHTDHEGSPILPAPNLLACFIDGGKYFKSGRNKITTQRSSLLPGAVFLNDEYYLIESEGGWKVDSRPVRIPATGGRILRHRPMFDDWAVRFMLTIDVLEMSEKLVRDIVDTAGKKSGLGDFRPGTKGPYGRFVVTLWEDITDR